MTNSTVTTFAILGLATLTACGGGGDGTESNPVTGGLTAAADPTAPTDPAAPTVNGIPTELANNLLSVNYDPSNQLLTLELQSFDAPGEAALYTRAPALDATVAGYQAYVRQDDPLDRFFLAIAGTSANGEVSAVAVTDGGQFNRFFGGGFYEQDGSYATDRTSGLVSYAGNYAASTNIGANGDVLLPVPAGTAPSIIPREPAVIQGQIFLNVDFGDNAINGQIFNRQFTEAPGLVLPNIELVEGTIADDGTFLGSTEIEVDQSIGAFGGTFGGSDGTAVAGVTQISDYSDDFDAEQEYGVFVLERCGTANEDAALCDSVNP